PWTPTLPAGREAVPTEVADLAAAHAAVANAPLAVDVSDGGVVGIAGHRSIALALARSLVCQVAVHHGPADVGVSLVGPEEEWDWMKWLPPLTSVETAYDD